MLYTVLVEFHNDFVRVNGTVITIGLMEKPLKGQANKELIKKLAKHFGISSSRVVIRSGIKSKTKMIEILS